MAKTRIDPWSFWEKPVLFVNHIWDPTQPHPHFHIIAISDFPHWECWEIVTHVPCDVDAPKNPLLWYAYQLDLAAILLCQPELLSCVCTTCHGHWKHPFHIVYDIDREENWPWRVPACAYDASRPNQWTDDFWPPDRAPEPP